MDAFKGYQDQPHHSARNFFDVVPNDGADLPFVPKGIVADVAGNIAMVGENGTQVIFAANAKTFYQVAPQRIMATGTTAVGIHAFH